MIKTFLKQHMKSIVFLAGLFLLIAASDFVFAQSGYIGYILRSVDKAENQYDTVVLGASHARCSVNPKTLDEKLGTSTINMSILGETVKDAYYVLLETDNHNDIRQVILDIDYQYFYGEQREGYFAEAFIYNQLSWNSPVKWRYMAENLDKLDFRNGISQRNVYLVSPSSVFANIRQKTSQGYKDADIYTLDMSSTGGHYEGNGFFPLSVSGQGPANAEYIEEWIGKEQTGIADMPREYLLKIINYCRDNNIELICVTAPITPSCMSRLGLDVVDEDFTKLFEEEGVAYYNFNKARLDVLPRADEDFVDYEGHMGEPLAYKYSEVLGSVLNAHMSGNLNADEYFYESFDEMFREMEE